MGLATGSARRQNPTTGFADRAPGRNLDFPRGASAAGRSTMAKKNKGGGPAVEMSLSAKDRAAIAAGLSKLLADTYTLYLKTHNFHWNVTGPMFNTLHLMFEAQYNELALAVDLVAERIRALGHPAPGSYAQYAKLSSIPEETKVPKAEEMIRQLVEAQEAVVKTARSVFPAAERAADQVTMDLLTQRMQVHEKTAWMLRSLLE
jgi:starvation-inducible DNA-binding protein